MRGAGGRRAAKILQYGLRRAEDPGLRVSSQALIARRYEHRVLAVMLICLHLSIWWDFTGALSRSLMLAHLGLFLLWQPLWSRERRLDLVSGVIAVVGVAVFIYWLNWVLVTFWLLLLTGFVGVGGGFLIVPALVLLGGLPMHLAVGTSLVIIALKSLTGFIK